MVGRTKPTQVNLNKIRIRPDGIKSYFEDRIIRKIGSRIHKGIINTWMRAFHFHETT
jgi:hypothetical protein